MLLEAVASDVRRYLRRRAGEQVADEVLADVMTVLWRRLDDVPTDEPLAWCYGVARRCLANHLRAEKRRLKLVERLAAQPAYDGQPAESSDAEDELRAALASLTDDDREVLTLRYLEELSSAEAAAVLGISGDALLKRQVRALKRLRSLLDDLTGPSDTGRR